MRWRRPRSAPSAGAATGGVVGALVSAGVPEHEAHVYCEAVRRGGTMVSVRAADDKAATVQRIMDRHEPIDPVERRTIYTGEGWKRFDPAAAPYTPSQAEIERLRRPYRELATTLRGPLASEARCRAPPATRRHSWRARPAL